MHWHHACDIFRDSLELLICTIFECRRSWQLASGQNCLPHTHKNTRWSLRLPAWRTRRTCSAARAPRRGTREASAAEQRTCAVNLRLANGGLCGMRQLFYGACRLAHRLARDAVSSIITRQHNNNVRNWSSARGMMWRPADNARHTSAINAWHASSQSGTACGPAAWQPIVE